MNISPVSFGSTYKLVNNKDYARIDSTMRKFNNNLKTLTGEEYPADITKHSNGAFYLLTGVEATISKRIKDAPLQPGDDELTLSTSKKVSLYGGKKQLRLDGLIDTTYLGKDVKVNQGLFVIV